MLPRCQAQYHTCKETPCSVPGTHPMRVSVSGQLSVQICSRGKSEGGTTTVMNDPAARNFPQGLPIYDSQGNQLGTVSSLGVLGNYLVMSKKALFRNDVSVPLSTIRSSDA